MLDTLLAGIGGFGRAHGIGDMPDKRDAQFLGLVGGGEVAIARNQRLNLDEVHSSLLEVVHSLARVGGIFYGRGTRKTRHRTVEHWARDHHPGSEKLASVD